MTHLRDKLKSHGSLRGIFISSGSVVIAELAGACGFDWVLLDREHGVGSDSDTLHQMMALATTKASPLVRVGDNSPSLIRQALDAGAHGIMVPHVQTADDAKAAVAATRHEPQGCRGFSSATRSNGYGLKKGAPLPPVVAVQLETPAAIANAAAIAATDGVDVVFIGPSDLTLAMGIHGQTEHPSFLEACRAVSAVAAKHGIRAGILARNPKAVREMEAAGFTFLAIASDMALLRDGMKAALS